MLSYKNNFITRFSKIAFKWGVMSCTSTWPQSHSSSTFNLMTFLTLDAKYRCCLHSWQRCLCVILCGVSYCTMSLANILWWAFIKEKISTIKLLFKWPWRYIAHLVNIFATQIKHVRGFEGFIRYQIMARVFTGYWRNDHEV